ncbi:MAG TPA: inorganic phosphate transporter [Methanomassiliicoccales archaeon]|nr:inorganic phosphate transporter [Methanomassiliicoccales archaeon]
MDLLTLSLAVVGLAVAIVFAFTNGFQDAATTAATMVASRSATPRQAIIMIAVMNGVGAMIGGSAVAFTIADLVDNADAQMSLVIMLSALLGAVTWNLITWYYGIPSSSTHGLVGGIIGAGVALAGTGSVNWGLDRLISSSMELVGVTKIVFYLLFSVMFGFVVGYLIYKLSKFLLRNAGKKVNRDLRRSQWVVAAIFALANGANDSQKQLGIMALIVLSAGMTATLDIPLWARALVALAMGLGTLAGGWRIMKTLGRQIFDIEPIHSLDSQIVSGTALVVSTIQGAPISSTQVVSSSILGIGAAVNPRKVRWGKGKEIAISWLITIPASAAIAGGVALLLWSVI